MERDMRHIRGQVPDPRPTEAAPSLAAVRIDAVNAAVHDMAHGTTSDTPACYPVGSRAHITWVTTYHATREDEAISDAVQAEAGRVIATAKGGAA
jgi:hypothetical protein